MNTKERTIHPSPSELEKVKVTALILAIPEKHEVFAVEHNTVCCEGCSTRKIKNTLLKRIGAEPLPEFS